MAVTDAQVKQWFKENPNASDKEIARVAKEAGVDSTQLARVTKVDKDKIEKRASAVGVDLSTKSTKTTKDKTKKSVDKAANKVSDTQATNNFNTAVERARAGDVGAFGQLIYTARQSGQKIPKELIEQVAYSAFQDKDQAYGYAVGAQAVAEGYEARDQALADGNTELAGMLQDKLTNDAVNFYNDVYSVYRPEGQAHGNLRKETAEGNPFDIGDPGEYQTSFFEGIGDLAQDFIENPIFKMAIALNPATAPFAPFISAATTKLSGDEISPLQVGGMLASAPGALSQASTLAGTQYDTGFLSPQSIELATQQVGLEPNWLTLGQDVSSGITTESDLLRGAQQGGVMAGATALGGASDLDIAKAFANQQMIDLGLEGMLSNPEISGALGSLQGLGINLSTLKDFSLPEIADINIPGIGLSLGDIETSLPFDLGELKMIAGALPDFNLPSATLPEFDIASLNMTAPDFTLPEVSGIDIPDINIPNVDLPSAPDFNLNMQGPSGPDINIDIPFPDLPKFAFDYAFKTPTLGIDPMDEIAKYLYPTAQDEEDIKLSEVLLRGAV